MGKKIKTILFDLDGTLIPEDEALTEAFSKTSQLAITKYNVDPQQLAVLARNHARKLFYGHSSYPFCERIGAGSGEALCADFTGDAKELKELRQFASEFRTGAWLNALEELGFSDKPLAENLANAFREVRASYYKLYPGIQELLKRLSSQYTLGIITNGLVDLQQLKIDDSKAGKYIPQHIISGEIGVGKPDPMIFKIGLQRLSSKPETTLMVGNSLVSDIQGASQLGIRSVFVSSLPNNSTTIQPTFRIEKTSLLESVLA